MVSDYKSPSSYAEFGNADVNRKIKKKTVLDKLTSLFNKYFSV